MNGVARNSSFHTRQESSRGSSIAPTLYLIGLKFNLKLLGLNPGPLALNSGSPTTWRGRQLVHLGFSIRTYIKSTPQIWLRLWTLGPHSTRIGGYWKTLGDTTRVARNQVDREHFHPPTDSMKIVLTLNGPKRYHQSHLELNVSKIEVLFTSAVTWYFFSGEDQHLS